MIKGENFEVFSKREFIFISNILDGINNYKHICFSGDYNKIKTYIMNLVKESREAFFDFYYPNLLTEDKNKFLQDINYNEIIKEFGICKDKIYFNINGLDTHILKFIIKISFDEILFSTFYFKEPNITIWTNYNNEIILFFNKKEEFIKYRDIGHRYGLNTIFEKE